MPKKNNSKNDSRNHQAIEAPRRSLFLMDPHEVVLIGLDTKDGPSHPRYDVRVHNNFDEDIVLGMMADGVEKPISVVKVGDRLEVVDGRQRVINAREANRRIRAAGGMPLRIPVLPPKHGTDAKLFALSVRLNEHVVTDTAFGRGQKAAKMQEMGYSDEEIGHEFRVSVETIRNYISLLDLKPEIQKMVLKGEVAASKGYELAKKGDKAQAAFLDRKEHGSRSGDPKRTPSKTALRKLVEEGTLPAMFLMGLRYALGDIESLDEIKAGATPVIPEPAKSSPRRKDGLKTTEEELAELGVPYAPNPFQC